MSRTGYRTDPFDGRLRRPWRRVSAERPGTFDLTCPFVNDPSPGMPPARLPASCISACKQKHVHILGGPWISRTTPQPGIRSAGTGTGTSSRMRTIPAWDPARLNGVRKCRCRVAQDDVAPRAYGPTPVDANEHPQSGSREWRRSIQTRLEASGRANPGEASCCIFHASGLVSMV